MLIVTWNVNSLKARLPRVTEWLDEVRPDVVCMQETKMTDAAFPALTFKSRRVQAISGDTFQLVGDLTIKNISKEVVLDVEFAGAQKDPWGNQKSGFTATTRISRTAFDLTWNAALETGGVLVGDDIKISLDVQLLKTT